METPCYYCDKQGHEKVKKELVCFDKSCKSPGFFCSSCLKDHIGHYIIASKTLAIEIGRKQQEVFTFIDTQKRSTIEDFAKLKDQLNLLENNAIAFFDRFRGFFQETNVDLLNNLNFTSTEQMNNLYSDLLNLDISGNKKVQVSYEQKLKVIYQIANAMNYLHSNDPPIIHGHLTPNNILFNSKNEPIISDLGFHCLKKYCKFMIGYANKNEYTAPEYLEEKSNVVENARMAADIYSFGMIVWELITEMKPFKTLAKEDLVNKVVIEKSRPKIPDNIPSEISHIIRACWQHEEDKRPSFGKILKLLENFI